MSSSKTGSDEGFTPEKPILIKKNPPLPQPGYGLIFSEALAQQVSEFVDSPLFKTLKRVYALQAKDRTARQCLQGAQNTEWLMYYKGVAAAADIFFKDMEAAKKAYIDANSDEKDDKKFKK